MNIQWVGPAPATNYSPGRQGNPVAIIVQHWMAGTIDAALARFMNPASVVSAHYLVGQKRGQILQLVRDTDTAFHAGAWDFNVRSIGIEAEASPTMPPTDDLYANLTELYQHLRDTHGLTLDDGMTVLPHRAIVATQCPGTIDIPRIIRQAQEGDMDEAGVIAAVEKKYDLTNTISAVKDALGKDAHHVHPEPPNISGERIVVPFVGAKWFGSDADFTRIGWNDAQGTTRYYTRDGKLIT